MQIYDALAVLHQHLALPVISSRSRIFSAPDNAGELQPYFAEHFLFVELTQ